MATKKVSRIVVPVLTVLFVLLSFSNYFSNNVLNTITEASDKISESTKAISIMTKGIGFFYSSKVNGLEGFVKVTIDELDKVSDYLTVANILLEIQELILKFSNLLIVKLLPLLFLIGFYIKRFKTISLKLLMYSLLICPGLSIFTQIIHEVPKIMNEASLGKNLHTELKTIEQEFQEKQDKLKAHQKKVKERQLSKAKAKGREDIGFIKRTEDAIVNSVENTALKVEKEAKIIKETFIIDTEKLLLYLVKLISMVILLVVLLPLFYFFGITIIVKEVLLIVKAIRNH